MEIRALIIDDEPLAQNVIQQYAKKLPNLIISGICNDALCAHQMLQNKETDLIFLDINMPKMSGISFLRTLKDPPLAILTTAYSEYALEGYELDVVDYLKKPFSFDRFCKAFYKAEELLLLKQKSGKAGAAGLDSDFIFIKSNKKNIKVRFDEISYIEGLGDYIIIHVTGEKIVTNLSMKKMEQLLPKNKFYRVHKSYIVSIAKIELVEGNLVRINRVKIPLGNNYKQDFIQFINRHSAE